MKVILIQDIQGVGRKGEQREVADGYYLNYLLPKQLAVLPSDPKAKNLQTALAQKQQSGQEEIEKIKKLAAEIDRKRIELSAKARGDTLFGAINVATVAEALHIDKKLFTMEPIKTTGEHDSILKFSHGIRSTIHLVIHPQ